MFVQPCEVFFVMSVRLHLNSFAERCGFLFRSTAFKLLRAATTAQCNRDFMVVHIGHHFWGAGNVGDDFMLAGFLVEMRKATVPVRFTCCVPFDREQLAKLHAEIEWKGYSLADRWSAIQDADCWLGLGGTPFQTDCGDWLEKHLDMERQICECLNKPMYFLGVGVGNAEALQKPKYKRLIKTATHFWGRDEMSASMLAKASEGKASRGADLANILFSQSTGPLLDSSVGCLMHFEDRSLFSVEALSALLNLHPDLRHLWLVQESRSLRWSEKALWQELPAALRSHMQLSEPKQGARSMNELLDSWCMPEMLISSRYHGSLLAAWSGSRVVVIARNDKLSGLASQLGIPSIDALSDTELLVEAMNASKAVPQQNLRNLACMASCSVQEWVEHAFKSTKPASA